MTENPRKIVIVGRDAALWLGAATIRAALGPAGVEVSAIELPSRLTPASAYASLPALEALHSRLGLDEADLLRAVGGSFSLGWNIVLRGRPPHFLAHGAYGAPIAGRDFFSCWMKGRRHGLGVALEDFSPTAMAARQGRLLLPDEETEQFGRTDYSYHLPAFPYVSLLKSRAQKLGVTINNAVEIGIEQEAGRMRSVVPDGKEPISGDLFIDASGPEAALIGSMPGARSEEWREFFPVDRLLRARANRFSSVPIYSELKLSPAGWTALHGTQAATHVVHAYSSELSSDEECLARAETASGLRLEGASIEPVAPGLRSSAWAGNCIAIGASACALDPLFDLELHVIQLGLVHLVSLFPAGAPGGEAERAEYNRVTRSSFERLRDFQAALYFVGGHAGSAPISLHHKLEAFRARGTVAPMEDETFSSDQWRAWLTGLDITPETWPPAIDTLPPDRLKDGFRQLLGFVKKKVLEQPAHDRYLADIGARGPA